MAILLTLGIVAGSIIIPSIAAWWQAQAQGQQIRESVHNEFQNLKDQAATATGTGEVEQKKDNTIITGIVAAIIIVIVIYIATRD